MLIVSLDYLYPNNQDNNELEDDMYYQDIVESIPVSAKTIAKESRCDKIISKVITFVTNDEWPTVTEPELRFYHTRKHELVVTQNCLLWGHRVVPPKKLHQHILQSLHQGHLGIAKMKALARNYFWWPGIDKDIETMSKMCSGCATTQPDPPLAPLHPWQWPEKPWQRIHIDFAGPFMNSMFLIIVDAHTKWTEILPTTSTTTSATINLLSSIFARFGLPEQLVSDNGPQFSSDEFTAFMTSNHIKHVRSAPYHPATNGLAERMVSTFKSAMKAAKKDEGTMHFKLSRFLFAYRNAPHSTTGETPAFMMFNRHLRTKLDIAKPSIKSRVADKQDHQVKSHSQASLRTYHTGDHVLVRDYRGHDRWQHGQISSQSGFRSYDVEIAPGVIWRRHSDQIVPTSSPVPAAEPALPPVPPVLVPRQAPTIATPVPETSGNSSQLPSENNAMGHPSTHPVEVRTGPPPRPDPQPSITRTNKTTQYVTRSGRVVQLPNKYKK